MQATWVDQALCYEAARTKQESCKTTLPVIASFPKLHHNKTFEHTPCEEQQTAPLFSLDPTSGDCFQPAAGAAGGAKYCTAQECAASYGVLLESVSVLNEGPSLGSEYGAEQVLDDTGTDGEGSIWLAPDGAPGWFVLNLGVTASLKKIVIKNTHNGEDNNRGTKSFQIAVSSDASLWSNVLHETLPDVRGVHDCLQSSEFVLEAFGPVQYVKFSTVSYFGEGAGINYVGLFAEPQLTGTRIQTIDVAVQNGEDDATESSNGNVATKSSALAMGDDGTSVMVAMRFADVQLPPGANIQHAVLRLRPDRIATGSSALTIHGELVQDSAKFDTAQNRDLSQRPQTRNQALWSPSAWSRPGKVEETGELRGVIQEIVRQEGWTSGHALTLLVNGLGSRHLSSYEGDSRFAPSLHIEYQGLSDRNPFDVARN